jgi:hypothetical protein
VTAPRAAIRVVLEGTGVSIDDMQLVNSWSATDRSRVVAALPAPWGEAIPLAYTGLPTLTDFRFADTALRGGATGFVINDLYARVRDLAWIEQQHATTAHATPSRAVTVYADERAPMSAVYRVLNTLAQGGFPDLSIAVRAGRNVRELALDPGMPPSASSPHWLVRIDEQGYAIGPSPWVQPGCRTVAATPAVAVPVTAGRLDAAGLSRCLAALRTLAGVASHDNAAIDIAASEAVLHRDLVATMLATRETRPGAHDLFASQALGLQR